MRGRNDQTCFYGLLITGGRGPLLGPLAGMLLPLALGLRLADRRLLASKALVASVVLFVAMAVVLLQASADFSQNLRALQRFKTLFTKRRVANRNAWNSGDDPGISGSSSRCPGAASAAGRFGISVSMSAGTRIISSSRFWSNSG
jgi:hypothetical protein